MSLVGLVMRYKILETNHNHNGAVYNNVLADVQFAWLTLEF